MIAWSNNKLKFTSGIGALCATALLAELSHEKLPIWATIAIVIVPICFFLFFQPGEMPNSVVIPCQLLGAVWYLVMALVLTVMFFRHEEKIRGWQMYFPGLIIGAIPCVIILRRLFGLRKGD